MSWNLSEEEIKTVTKLTDTKRYAYSIKRMAGWQEVWSLKSENGWVLLGDDNYNEIFPVWPHKLYAHACRTDEWLDAIPQLIDVHDFIEEWIPGFIKDNRLVAVFPTTMNAKAVVVTPERLKEDIQSELDLYE